MNQQHPYREVARPVWMKRARAGYFPAFGALRVICILLLALPVAWITRSESRAASTVTCSTAPETVFTTQAPCLVHDARVVGPFEPIACADTPAALDTLLDSKNPLARPFVTAVVSEGPPPPDMELAKADGVIIGGNAAAVYHKVKHSKRPPAPTFAHPNADANGGIDPDAARTLLASCVANPGASGPTQTVSFAIFERDFSNSVVVIGASFVFAILFVLRRRASVKVDEDGHLEIADRGFFLVRRRASIPLADIDRVVVATGLTGPFVGTRVDVICKNGDNVPLSESFSIFNRQTHARMAERVRVLVETEA